MPDLADLGGMEAINEDLLNHIKTWLHVPGFLDVKQELRTDQKGGPNPHGVAKQENKWVLQTNAQLAVVHFFATFHAYEL